MNRMQVKPAATMEMDVFGLRRRHDTEPFLRITDVSITQEDNMRYRDNDVLTFTAKTFGLKDEASDQATNSTADKFAQYQRNNPEAVAAVIARLGPNASITEVVLALDALPATQPKALSSSMKAWLEADAKAKAQNWARRVVAAYETQQATPPGKWIKPGYQRIF